MSLPVTPELLVSYRANDSPESRLHGTVDLVRASFTNKVTTVELNAIDEL
jgi:hypothetical protein